MPRPPMGNQINDRRTPPDLFKRYHDRYHFTLDAAASHENALLPSHCAVDGLWWKGGKVEDQDGLTYPWEGFRVWVNPPYGRGLLTPFVKKAEREAREHGVLVAMLLPVRTEQPWFQDLVWPAVCSGLARIEWVRGRLHFSGEKAGAPFPSMVVIWNDRMEV